MGETMEVTELSNPEICCMSRTDVSRSSWASAFIEHITSKGPSTISADKTSGSVSNFALTSSAFCGLVFKNRNANGFSAGAGPSEATMRLMV